MIVSRFNVDYLISAIAAELHISPAEVTNAVRFAKIPQQTRLEVIDLHRRGYSGAEIVKKTGLTSNRVHWIVRQWKGQRQESAL